MILRVVVYGATALLPIFLFLMMGVWDWYGTTVSHMVTEALASLLALIVGTMALVRYYARRESMYFYIAVAFFVVGLLDAYQAIVTTELLNLMSTSDISSIAGWGWIASRQFLGLFLLLSWLSWLREERHGLPERINNKTLVGFGGVFVAITMLVLTLVPLPSVYFPDFILPRPEELVPAVFLLMAVVGYIFKGRWRYDVFEHWFIISLIIGLVVQVLFMSTSSAMFDASFSMAHTLKLVSYMAVLVGLILSMELDNAVQLHAVVDSIAEGIITINKRGIILSINPAARRIFGRLESELIDHSIEDIVSPSNERDELHHMMVGTSRRWRKLTHHVVEVEGIKLNGDSFPLEFALTRLDYASGHMFVAAMRDITVRMEMDRVKSEFIATVSHELRTPLTVILGYLPLLSKEGEMPAPNVVARLANNMKHSGEHLLALVTDLLDISRIEAGRLVLERVPLSTREVVDSVIGIMEAASLEKGLKLVPDVQEGIVHGDDTRLKQVLINLVGNAIKFTDKGEVIISAKKSTRGVNFTVSDTGMGVPYEQLDTIFDRFQQVDGSQTRRKGGTGLGLAITRSLVELHGGTISATSSLGNGTKFVFDIPDIE